MASPVDLHAVVLAVLRGIPHMAVYDGDVPDAPPADPGGLVWPYLVLWPGAGWVDPTASTLDGTANGALAWEARITAAGGTPTRALQAAHAARQVVAGLIPAPGAAPLTEQPGPGVLRDDDVTPARWYAPLTFTTQAP